MSALPFSGLLNILYNTAEDLVVVNDELADVPTPVPTTSNI